MIERLSKLIALFTITAFIGCDSNTDNNTTYFGGKIINPKSDHVVLFNSQVPLDTFYLDQNDTFLGEIPSLNQGLYYFRHGNQHQYIYLEPKDSLLIRLNYWDFDESLVFSGKGAERNNMLIDCFLEAEKYDKTFYRYYHLPPADFKNKVDSIEALRLDRYDQFTSKNPKESDEYKSILKIALTFPLYSKLENYPMAHNAKKSHVNHDEVNRDFYSHRDKITLDKDSIMYFYAYRNFIISNMYNKVSTAGHEVYSDAFTVGLLKTIASELSNDNTRNAILRQTMIGHFYRKSSCDVNNDAFDTYLSLSTNDKDKKLVTNLLSDTKKMHKGAKIEDFHITDYNKTDRSIASVIKGKSTVLYFWNPDFVSKDYLGSRIQLLSNKYPNIKFVGVKIDGDHTDRIRKLDIKTQYYINSKSDANLFLSSKMPRTILVNKKGIVSNGYASLSSPNIYKQIEVLDKK
jgi:hypothetical protein